MVQFALAAQVCGNKFRVSASPTQFGYAVESPAGSRAARSASEALRIACRQTADFLDPARAPGVPWGLHVSVGEVAAVYGEWPLLPAPPDNRRPPDSPVSRIRRRWHDGDGPMAAVDNARQIVEYYAEGRRAA
jgi:hypothetical protein